MNDQERTMSFEARHTQWLPQLIEAVIFAQLVCKPDVHGVQELLIPILITPEPGRPWWFHVFLDISEPGYDDKHFEAHDVPSRMMRRRAVREVSTLSHQVAQTAHVWTRWSLQGGGEHS